MAEQMKIDIFRFLRNLLQTHLYTGLITPCIVNELQLLNKAHNNKFEGAVRLANRFKMRECSCETRQSASACIAGLLGMLNIIWLLDFQSPSLSSVTGKDNPDKFFVATQDRELKAKARNIPGVPIIVFSNNVLIMEGPSTVSKQFVSQVTAVAYLLLGKVYHGSLQRETAKLNVPSTDLKLVKATLKKQQEELKAKMPIR